MIKKGYLLSIIVIFMYSTLSQAKTEVVATWVCGSSTIDQSGVYGTKGISNPTNVPGARTGSISWADSNDNLWLFGGCGFDSVGNRGVLNDLWKFDGTNWTWVSGSDTIDQSGVYGIKGVADPKNVPGARSYSISWTDSNGNLWLFGGRSYDSGDSLDSLDELNDLWKYDGTNWTWVSGSAMIKQSGVYGIKGIADPANVPGARSGSISWIDSSGNLWLFGGCGFDGINSYGVINDLWKYDGTSWTWVSGSSRKSQFGTYGTQGVADPENILGARDNSISWIDSSGNFWLFGGGGFDRTSYWGIQNDLWKYDGTNWTWMSGSDTRWQCGRYGTKGVADAANRPGAREVSISWIDSRDNLWLFGGNTYSNYCPSGTRNDLWKYDGTNWTWVGSSSGIRQSGVYGIKGIADSANRPGARYKSISWTDSSDNLWLFGGRGVDSSGGWGDLNDLWKIQIFNVYYIDSSATGNNDGSNWTNAYTELQDGLDAAISGDEIWVAAGTYSPTKMIDPCDPRTATFQMINEVGIYGGFPTEGNPGWLDRNPDMYETILSGDLLGNDNPATLAEDLLDDPCRADNCYHVFYHPEGTNLNSSAILDGFTITGGIDGSGMENRENCSPIINHCMFTRNAKTDFNICGGMYNYLNSNPIVTNCTFSDNDGSGIENYKNSSPIVSDCIFTNNSGIFGGGICNQINCSPIVTNCTFNGNSSYQYGGGIYNRESDSTITHCTFIGNMTDRGGGIFNLSCDPVIDHCIFSDNITDEGGGINNRYSSPIIANCIFSNNSAISYHGGGIYNLNSDPTIINCDFNKNFTIWSGGGIYNYQSSPTVTYCSFSGNWANGDGGGITNWQDCSPTVTNCSFSGNSSQEGGGISNVRNCNPKINNCTFNYNSASENGGGIYYSHESNPIVISCILSNNSAPDGPEIYNSSTGSISVIYSNVKGGWPGVGNIDVDPLFVDADGADDIFGTEDDDLHLLPDSLCIDAGDPASEWENEPWPNGARVNMGAYGNTPEATRSRNGLQFESFGVIDITRVGRTVFEYVLSLLLTNITEEAMTDIQVNLIDATEQVVSVSDDSIFLPVIDAHSTVDSDDVGDYFVVTINRAELITPGRLTWQVDYSGIGGAGMQIMSGSLPMESTVVGDLTGDNKVTLDDVARLGEYWLIDSPERNLAGDEIINIEDLLILVRNWLSSIQ
ncbi:MAG: right-handed parallel beta-helix repeat-containing protein [Sedimentisphaerales bacterium]|nr:right-handed parallel beta-helix repeat-containing protein [Sedimentisphaerales bacterium]